MKVRVTYSFEAEFSLGVEQAAAYLHAIRHAAAMNLQYINLPWDAMPTPGSVVLLKSCIAGVLDAQASAP